MVLSLSQLRVVLFMDPPLRFTTFSVTIPPVPTQSPREPPAAFRYNLVSPHQSSLFVPSLGLADASSLVVCFAIFLARSICFYPRSRLVGRLTHQRLGRSPCTLLFTCFGSSARSPLPSAPDTALPTLSFRFYSTPPTRPAPPSRRCRRSHVSHLRMLRFY